MSAQRALLPGNRLHLNDGPIDLVIGAEGEAREVERAYAAAWDVFPAILPRLVEELAILRAPIAPSPRPSRGEGHGQIETSRAAPPLTPDFSPLQKRSGEREMLSGPVARRMADAVRPYAQVFITPMAAVAGSVAEEVLGAMVAAARLDRAYVNNGGDIALHLGPGASISIGVVADVSAPAIDARVVIRDSDPVRGIATSGWRGRSHSLGIADAVTVLGPTASAADAAATMIANAVDVVHAAIRRRPARELRHDSDLGDIPVTVDVGPLPAEARAAALASGIAEAEALIARGLIVAAYLALQGETRVAGGLERPGTARTLSSR